jgi:hypothetical protein
MELTISDEAVITSPTTIHAFGDQRNLGNFGDIKEVPEN